MLLQFTKWRSNSILWCLAGISTNKLLTWSWITLGYWRNHPSTQQAIVPGVICIEGNIGSGKSTLLSGLRQGGLSVFQEPVQTRWKKCLSTYYENRSRWGITFQIEVFEWFNLLKPLFAAKQNHKVSSVKSPILVERSPMAAYHIFAKDMQRSGHVTIWEISILRRLTKKWGWIPEHTFFAHTSYKVALMRLSKRDRTAEKSIQKDFLWQLELRHRAFIHSGLCGKVHILDGSLSKQDLLISTISEIAAIHDSKCVRDHSHITSTP